MTNNTSRILQTFREVKEESEREQTQRIDRICSTITSQPFDKDHLSMLIKALEVWVEEAASWKDITGETDVIVSLQDADGFINSIRMLPASQEEREEAGRDEAVDARIKMDKEEPT